MALYQPDKWARYVSDNNVTDCDVTRALTGAIYALADRHSRMTHAFAADGSVRPDWRMHEHAIAYDKEIAGLFNLACSHCNHADATVAAAALMLALSIQKRRHRMAVLEQHFVMQQPRSLPPDGRRKRSQHVDPRTAPEQTMKGRAAAQLPNLQSAALQRHVLDGKVTHGRMMIDNQLRLTGGYLLEKADPLHRAWGEHGAMRVFEDWKLDADKNGDFFAWVSANRFALALRYPDVAHIFTEDRGVRYLAPDEKFQYLVAFGDGLLWHRSRDEVKAAKVNYRLNMSQVEANTGFHHFSTKSYSTLYNQEAFAIWVLSPEGKFYSHKHEKNKFHHSSFLAGDDVLAGGEWAVSNGRLICICDKTGHYQSNHDDFIKVCKLLAEHVDLEDVIFETALYSQGLEAERFYYWLRDWLDNYPHNRPSNTPIIGHANPHATLAAIYQGIKDKVGDEWQQAFNERWSKFSDMSRQWIQAIVKNDGTLAGRRQKWWAEHKQRRRRKRADANSTKLVPMLDTSLLGNMATPAMGAAFASLFE